MFLNCSNSFPKFISTQIGKLNSSSISKKLKKIPFATKIIFGLAISLSGNLLYYWWEFRKSRNVKKQLENDQTKFLATQISKPNNSPSSKLPSPSAKNQQPSSSPSSNKTESTDDVESIEKTENEDAMNSVYEQLEKFYLNQGVDSEGRTLKELQDLTYAEKESKHDYIQWMFPTNEQSQFNSDAPVLTAKEYHTLSENPIIKGNVRTSFDKILEFYGLKYDDQALAVIKNADFEERSKNWLVKHDHNHLRISRILKCLNLFGLHHEMIAFHVFLETLKPLSVISKEAYKYYDKNIMSIPIDE